MSQLKLVPALQGIMPKEQELISIIKKELEQKRKVLVYIQNSNTTDISPRLVDLIEDKQIKVKVLRSGDTEGRAKIIQRWVKKGIDVLITNPKKVEVGMDLLDFPSIIFFHIPMSTYTLRQASRRSWRIPQKKPVRIYFLTYSGTMQTRLMKLFVKEKSIDDAIEIPLQSVNHNQIFTKKNVHTKLVIYNIMGQVVRTLVDGKKLAGEYSVKWNARNYHGEKVSSGVYFYQLEAGKFKATKRMMFVR